MWQKKVNLSASLEGAVMMYEVLTETNSGILVETITLSHNHTEIGHPNFTCCHGSDGTTFIFKNS